MGSLGAGGGVGVVEAVTVQLASTAYSGHREVSGSGVHLCCLMAANLARAGGFKSMVYPRECSPHSNHKAGAWEPQHQTLGRRNSVPEALDGAHGDMLGVSG
jgi:hypothetical protein